eukprot:2233026-Ditylum_brightwellii.AAC.1
MPHPHNHEEWLAQRKAKQATQDNKTPDGAAKRKFTEDKPGFSKQAAAAGKSKLSKVSKPHLSPRFNFPMPKYKMSLTTL